MHGVWVISSLRESGFGLQAGEVLSEKVFLIETMTYFVMTGGIESPE